MRGYLSPGPPFIKGDLSSSETKHMSHIAADPFSTQEMNVRVSEPICWHIAGIGALGGLLAAEFYRSGQAVRLILKNEMQLAAYRETGLTVSHSETVFTSHPQAIDLSSLGNEPIHYLICCVKAYDITRLLMRLKNNLHEKSLIILLHNGLGVLDEIQSKLPTLRIIPGISTLGAYLKKPFHVSAFLAGKVYLGSGIGQFSAHEINTVCQAFAKTALPYQWEDNIQGMMWEKFALNCSINLLTAIFTCKNGDLRQHDDLLKAMTGEIAQVLCAHGHLISADDLFSKVTQVIKNTAGNYSSMYKDVQHNKLTEINYLNEHLITLAAGQKIPTPVNTRMLNLFHAKLLKHQD